MLGSALVDRPRSMAEPSETAHDAHPTPISTQVKVRRLVVATDPSLLVVSSSARLTPSPCVPSSATIIPHRPRDQPADCESAHPADKLRYASMDIGRGGRGAIMWTRGRQVFHHAAAVLLSACARGDSERLHCDMRAQCCSTMHDGGRVWSMSTDVAVRFTLIAANVCHLIES